MLPALDEPIVVSSDVAEAFRRDGHALVRGVATAAEVAAYRAHLSEAAEARKRETRPLEERDVYGQAFLQMMNLWRVNEAARRFVWAPRFAKVAADLLGVDGVRLYHDQALFKEPGGGPTPWHQDQVYWPLDTRNTITMWMPLVDIPSEVGSMTFATGSHRAVDPEGHAGYDISESSDAEVAAAVEASSSTLTTYGALRAGDATFHAGWTLHRADPNPTPTMREVMTIIYFADGARATKPRNLHQELDLKHWLKDTEPGEAAAGPRNPRLWPAA